uniref:Uncharacterized protein n=1 Tax=Glossina pallidipes TaxID=7398 RepID=A0A1A9ZC11_GLOPL
MFGAIVCRLAAGIKNLRELVLKIDERCEVKAMYAGLQHCCYLPDGKKLLIKFSPIYIRDAVMMEYVKDPSIKLSYGSGVSIHSQFQFLADIPYCAIVVPPPVNTNNNHVQTVNHNHTVDWRQASDFLHVYNIDIVRLFGAVCTVHKLEKKPSNFPSKIRAQGLALRPWLVMDLLSDESEARVWAKTAFDDNNV